jgi:hypothetical protein
LLPIRKIAPTIVALSTYYGKTFVQVNPKVSNNSVTWLHRQLNLAIITDGGYIQKVSPGNVFYNEVVTPYIYGAIAEEFEKFSAGDFNFYFNYMKRGQFIDAALLKSIEKDGRVFCGYVGTKIPIVVDNANLFIALTPNGEKVIGDIYQALKLSREKAPLDFSEIRVFSKYIPVGVVLGFYIGFKNLLALVNAKYRTVPARKNKEMTEHEFAITFKDQSYVVDGSNPKIKLILAGFTDYEKSIKQFESDLFDHRDVYFNLFTSKGLGSIYIRELEMMEESFIDPISKEILETMKEPVTFKGLLLRANELLTTYYHPVSQDRNAMRDRGYERFSGVVYKELMKAIRQFRNKNMAGKSKIDISPYEVWNAIMKDNSLKIVEDINPIQNLKEGEVVTYSGDGGRDKDTMTKPTRAYHLSNVGIDSESTVDSTGVGTIVYTSANPNFRDVRGLSLADKELSPTNMLSTSALLSPASTTDLPKRIMFISTQHSHTVASEAYRQPMLKTGYENVIGKRTSKLFCSAAEEDGVVESITEKGMVVRYASGEKDGIELGRLYGKAEGTTYPHDLVTGMKAGMKFKKGDILAYNTKFFEKDFRNPKEVALKINTVATVAFMEVPSTHEDSSTLSPSLSEKLQTEVIKMKSYIVQFTQNLRDVKQSGESVTPRDVLMIIEDEITAKSGSFSNESMDVLKRLSNAAPRAGVSGLIEKIEIFYHGEKRDMSATLKRLADKSDLEMSTRHKDSGQPNVTGRVTEEYRVAGKSLELDHAEVRIYISVKAPTGVGDKVVFGHQMKSTIAEVHSGQIYAEDGRPVDAVFSYRSVAARGVHSPALVGTTTTLLETIAKRAVKSFHGDK